MTTTFTTSVEQHGPSHFRASCGCGWRGILRSDRDESVRDGDEHQREDHSRGLSWSEWP